MNGGWRRLRGSEIISLTLMELFLLLSFVCLVVIKGFYEENREIGALTGQIDKVIVNGGGKPSIDNDNLTKRLAHAMKIFEKLPPGWTSLSTPTIGEAALLKKNEEFEIRIKQLTERGDPEQLFRDKQQLIEEIKKLKDEREYMRTDLIKANPIFDRKYPAQTSGAEGGAPGKKPCWTENGKIFALYSITISEEEFFVKPLYPELISTTLPVKIAKDGQKFSTAQFHDQMRRVHEIGAEKGCAHYVKLCVKGTMSAAASNKGINIVNSYFYQLGAIQTVSE